MTPQRLRWWLSLRWLSWLLLVGSSSSWSSSSLWPVLPSRSFVPWIIPWIVAFVCVGVDVIVAGDFTCWPSGVAMWQRWRCCRWRSLPWLDWPLSTRPSDWPVRLACPIGFHALNRPVIWHCSGAISFHFPKLQRMRRRVTWHQLWFQSQLHFLLWCADNNLSREFERGWRKKKWTVSSSSPLGAIFWPILKRTAPGRPQLFLFGWNFFSPVKSPLKFDSISEMNGWIWNESDGDLLIFFMFHVWFVWSMDASTCLSRSFPTDAKSLSNRKYHQIVARKFFNKVLFSKFRSGSQIAFQFQKCKQIPGVRLAGWKGAHLGRGGRGAGGRVDLFETGRIWRMQTRNRIITIIKLKLVISSTKFLFQISDQGQDLLSNSRLRRPKVYRVFMACSPLRGKNQLKLIVIEA